MSRVPATLTRRRTRAAAVAGTFYPARRSDLEATVERLLDAAVPPSSSPVPKALIAPHAGYPYSGPIAASAFRCARALRDRVRRVVLVGPSHFVPFRGVASSGAGAFATPLGEVEIDVEADALLATQADVVELADAHGREHCLEVELPFL